MIRFWALLRVCKLFLDHLFEHSTLLVGELLASFCTLVCQHQ